MSDEDFTVEMDEVINTGGEGTADFDQLYNRPSYDGQVMTSETDIPKVPERVSDLEDSGDYATKEQVERSVSEAVAAETEARQAADETLAENIAKNTDEITNEATARQEADEALQKKIDGKQGTLTEGAHIDIIDDVISAEFDPATTQEDGLMSATDKVKLDSIRTAMAIEENDNGYATGGQVFAALLEFAKKAKSGSGAPTDATEADYVGQFYIDLTNAELYWCSAIDAESDPATYSWEKVGGAQYILYDDIGANTDGAMTQKATTDKVLGMARTLTEADYNWPADNPTAVALYKLPAGVYAIGPETSAFIGKGSYAVNSTYGVTVLLTPVAPTNSGTRDIYIFHQSSYSNGGIEYYGLTNVNADAFLRIAGPTRLLSEKRLSDRLTISLPGMYALDAHQGKVLKNLIDSLVISGAGAPTAATAGTVGKLYEDTTNGKLYQCTAVDTATPEYAWVEIGNSGVTVVQEMGTSTADVMSQAATTGLIRAGTNNTDGNVNISTMMLSVSGLDNIRVGRSASTGSSNDSAIAIGRGASATGIGSVALGRGASATTRGEMNIGASSSDYGYNSTNYRLLSGVYDGQSDHDAATVGQLNANLGKAYVLTEDDFNYDRDGDGVNDCVALWLLDDGLYSRGGLAVTGDVNTSKIIAAKTTQVVNMQDVGTFAVFTCGVNTRWIGGAVSIGDSGVKPFSAILTAESGAFTGFSGSLLGTANVVDDLDTAVVSSPLSARQGKALNEKIGGDLTALETTDKSSLIAAINELNTRLAALEDS